MSMTDLLVPTYRQMLRMLAGLLDKLQQQFPKRAEAALSARLADDMYPLSSQLRFAAYQAMEATFRLRGEAVPPWLDAIAAEGRLSSGGRDPGGMSSRARRGIRPSGGTAATIPSVVSSPWR